MKISSSIKQYGIVNSSKRIIKAILRRLGVDIESFWYLENTIDIKVINAKMLLRNYDDVRELTLRDFENIDSEIYSKDKYHLIKSRFKNGKYWCYGVFSDDKLVYLCWINNSNINYPSRFKKSSVLKPNQGLLEDAYCHSAYRGKGLHSKMNLYRLSELYKKGVDKVGVLVLIENTPALKTQLKSGLKKHKKITFLKLFGKQYYFEKKINDTN